MSLNGFQDPAFLAEEIVWFDVSKLQEAGTRYQKLLANENPIVGAMRDGPHVKPKTLQAPVTSSLVSEIENVRSKIQNFMKAADNKESLIPGQLMERLEKVEQDNTEFRAMLIQMSSDFEELINKVNTLEVKVSKLESVTKTQEECLEKEKFKNNMFDGVLDNFKTLLFKVNALDLKVNKPESVTPGPKKSSDMAVNSVKCGTAGEDEKTEDERLLVEKERNRTNMIQQMFHDFKILLMKVNALDLKVSKVESVTKTEEECLEKEKLRTNMILKMFDDWKVLLMKVNALDVKVSKVVTSEPEKSSVKCETAGEDDDVDLFGSDEETLEEILVKEQRLKEYEKKKAKKSKVVAKSCVVLDVKPWSDETDLKDMEIEVRKIKSDGLKWGASKLVPLAYGIKKLQISAVVEDDNCSIDWLQEQIESILNLVQSVDIAAFNKL